jgi:hypothetical protein
MRRMLLTVTFRADGNVLSVPMDNIRCHPKIGDVVSFSYEQTAKRAMPANVKVYRVRKDLNWEIVLHNYKRENSPLPPGGIVYANCSVCG